MNFKINLIILILSVFALPLMAQSIEGEWKTIDDETGKPKSIVKIYEAKNGKFYGKIIKLLDKSKGENPNCKKCPGELKDKPILEMVIIRDMVKNGTTWTSGRVLDPESGKDYSCKIWIENGNLKLRGYWGLFYRTQTWYKN